MVWNIPKSKVQPFWDFMGYASVKTAAFWVFFSALISIIGPSLPSTSLIMEQNLEINIHGLEKEENEGDKPEVLWVLWQGQRECPSRCQPVFLWSFITALQIMLCNNELELCSTCNWFLFPFLIVLLCLIVYLVLLCFYSAAVNKNIWQTTSLGMIHQPNHLWHWNTITCKMALGPSDENCKFFISLLCRYLSIGVSWVEKSWERRVGLYFKSIVVATLQIMAFSRPTIFLAIIFHINCSPAYWPALQQFTYTT